MPPESYGLFYLSLETEWGEVLSCPERRGPSRKDYKQEEKSNFRGGNVCVGSSKGWGLGENNQK